MEACEGSVTFRIKTAWPHGLVRLPAGIVSSEDWVYRLHLSIINPEEQIYRINFKADKNCLFDITPSDERTKFFINCGAPRSADIKFYFKTRVLFFERSFHHHLGAVQQDGLAKPADHEFEVVPVRTRGKLSAVQVSWHVPGMTDDTFILWRAPDQGVRDRYGIGHWGPVGGLFTNEEIYTDRFLRYEGQVWCYRLTSARVEQTGYETRYYCSKPSDACVCVADDRLNMKPLFDIGCGDWDDLR